MIAHGIALLASIAAAPGAEGIFAQLGDVTLTQVQNTPPNVTGVVDRMGNSYGSQGDGIVCTAASGNVTYALSGGQYPGRLFFALDPSGSGVLVLLFNSPRISLFHVVAGQPPEARGSLDLTANTVPSTTTDLYGLYHYHTVIDPSGRLCQPSSDGLYCFGAGTPLVAELVVSASAMMTQLLGTKRPSDLFAEIPATSAPVGTMVGPMIFAPDGTLYAVFSVEVMDFQLRWLLQRKPDGTALVRYGPELKHTTGVFAVNLDVRRALGRVTSLAIDAASGTLLAFPRAGRRLVYAPWAMHPVFDGVGVATFPLTPSANADIESPGHIELSAVIEQTIGDPGNPIAVQMRQGPGGVAELVGGSGIFALGFDKDGIDMDEDGLSAGEERTLGTSDFSVDTDLDEVRDNLEVRLYHSSPIDGSDGPRLLRRHPPDVDFAYSTLIRERLNEQIDRHYWPSEYLCGLGACWDRSGKKVLTGLNTNGPTPTEDPEKVIGRNAEGTELRRYTVATGASELVANVGDLVAFIPTGANTVAVPGKGKTVYMVSDKRVIAFGDAPVRVIFDLDQEQCRAKLLTCGPMYLSDRVYPQEAYQLLQIVGFDPVIDRLLVIARGSMDNALIGVSTSAPPILLASGNQMPELLLDTGMGTMPAAVTPDAMTPLASGELWSSYEGAAGFVDGDYRPWDSPNTSFLANFPGRGWDDSLFVYSAGGPTAQGLFELARMDGRISPGDVLLFAGPNSLNPGNFLPSTTKHGPYLYRVGRRGGVSPLYDHAVGQPGRFSELGAVRGMGIAPDGRICAAGLDGSLYELAHPDAERHLPDEVGRLREVHGASDCLYDPSGKLHVLIDAPPGILVIDTRTTEPGRLYSVAGMSTPSRFVWVREGQYRIADAAGPMQCADIGTGALTSSGLSIAGLTRGNDGSLFLIDRPDGKLLKADVDAVCSGATTPIGIDRSMLYAITAKPPFPWVVASMAQRPDGRLVVMPSRSRLVPYDVSGPIDEPAYLFFVDLADKSFVVDHHDFDFAGLGSALVRVPGGDWTDPWSATPVGPSPGADGGTASGQDAGVADGAGPEDKAQAGCSCQAEGASSGAPTGALIGLSLMLGRAARRREGTRSKPNARRNMHETSDSGD